MNIQCWISEIIAALGGSAVTWIIIFKFGANKITDMLLAKYQLRLDEKLETHKAKIDTENYVTKFQFDKEYEVLHKLIHDYYDFTFLSWNVYLNITTNSNSEFDKHYKKFATKCDNYTLYFFRNNVIVNKELADSFQKGIKKINDFRNTAKNCRNSFLTYESLDKIGSDGYQTHVIENIDKLKNIHDELNVGDEYGFQHMIDLVRDYLNSLQIVQ